MRPVAAVYPDRAAWLAGRAETNRTRLGASEVAAVLGLSPHAGPWDVWGRRNGIEPEPAKDAVAGLEWERYVLAWYCRSRGVVLASNPGLDVWVGDYLSATPDAVVRAPRDDGEWLAEVKCLSEHAPDARTWAERVVEPGEVPTMARISELDTHKLGCPVGRWVQVQVQLELTGLDRCDLVGFFGPQHCPVVTVLRDAAWMADTRTYLEAWVKRHLVGIDEQGFVDPARIVPPPRDESDACIAWTLRKLTEGERPATEAEREAMARYLAGGDAERDAEATKAAARSDLLASMAVDGVRKVWAPGATASVDRSGRFTVRGRR